MIILRKHQQQAYDAWLEQGANNIVKAGTGTGKTFVALKAVEINPKNIVIVVPTVALQKQWSDHLFTIGIEHGLVGDGNSDLSQEVTIGIINSMREKKIKCRLLVVDEVHRLLSPENYKIITGIECINFMGLSATPEKEDNAYWDRLSEKYPISSDYPLEDAIEEGMACDYDRVPIACELLPEERERYDKYTATIKRVMPMYAFNLQLAMSAIKRGGQGEAIALSQAMQGRKRVVAESVAKLIKTSEIINETKTKKIIVFAESINSLIYLRARISPERLVLEYHTKVKKKEREVAIKLFRESKDAVLLSARCLDEGIDVPDCDTAIVMSGTSSVRQFIQRLGRILRPAVGKSATLYELYIKDTVDAKWLRLRHKQSRMAKI